MTNKIKTIHDGSAITNCFFDIEFNKNPIGRIVMELFKDLCPITVNNFRSLCTGNFI